MDYLNELEQNTESIQQLFPDLTTFEALQIAAKIQHTEVLADGLMVNQPKQMVTLESKLPVGLEAMAIALGYSWEDGKSYPTLIPTLKQSLQDIFDQLGANIESVENLTKSVVTALYSTLPGKDLEFHKPVGPRYPWGEFASTDLELKSYHSRFANLVTDITNSNGGDERIAFLGSILGMVQTVFTELRHHELDGALRHAFPEFYSDTEQE